MGSKKRTREDAAATGPSGKRARLDPGPKPTAKLAQTSDGRLPAEEAETQEGKNTAARTMESEATLQAKPSSQPKSTADSPLQQATGKKRKQAKTDGEVSREADAALWKARRKEAKVARIRALQEEKSVVKVEPVASSDDIAVQPSGDVSMAEVATVQEPIDHTHPEWTLSPATAGRFIDQDPIFVTDAAGEQYLLSATSRETQVLSLETSLVERALPLPEDVVVACIALDAIESNIVHIAYSDGILAQWDWTSAEATDRKARTAQGDVLAMKTAAVEGDNVFCYISDLVDDSAICIGTQALFVTPHLLEHLCVLGGAEYIIASGPSCLVLGRLKGVDEATPQYKWIEIPLTSEITCMDVRQSTLPASNVRNKNQTPTISLALGTSEGQIHLYADILSVFNNQTHHNLPAPRILHWHREAVNAVKFSQDGNYLISGGSETVLVLWQLETGRKQFLPHLTSEIGRIVVSPKGDRYAVQLGDNSIMVLSTSELKPVAHFAGLQQLESDEGRAAAAVLHPRDGNKLLLTVPSTSSEFSRPFLQTFDLRTSRHMAKQALTRNSATDFNLGPERTPILPPDVTHLSISHDGTWLATVDEWMPPASDLLHLADDEEGVEEERRKRREVYLKFWLWDQKQELWTLSTRVDAPHARADSTLLGAGKVFKLVRDPRRAGFATIGEDGDVALWRPERKTRHGVQLDEALEWRCARMIGLPGASPIWNEEEGVHERGVSTACLAYSEDGSLLAASMTHPGVAGDEPAIIHFFDTDTGRTAGLKSFAFHPAGFADLAFLDRFLVAASLDFVEVWDLVSQRLVQRHKLEMRDGVPPLLAVSPADGSFAVVVGGRKVLVFKVGEEKSVFRTEVESAVAAVLPATGGGKGYRLLCTDATVRTLALTPAPPRGIAAVDNDVLDDIADEVAVPSLLALPSVKDEEQEEDKDLLILEQIEDDRPVVRAEQLAQIFDVGQSFAMPPVRDMFHAVVDLFGRKRAVETV